MLPRVRPTYVRPYTPSTGRWLVIGWEAVAMGLLAWATVEQFAVTGYGVHVLGGIIAALWVIGAGRILDMGVYVGPDGLQIRGLLRNRRMAWREIRHVRLHRVTYRAGRFELEGGTTVLIERGDGTTVNTELWAQGVDFHRRPKEFRAVYHELRDRHLAAVNA